MEAADITRRFIGEDFAGNAFRFQEGADLFADAVDTGLVLGAAVGVHEHLYQGQDGRLLFLQPEAVRGQVCSHEC
jgi:hypothetical protein